MTIMDAKGAAEAIRDAWHKDPPSVTAEGRHRHTFLEDVCHHLGVEPNAINVAHVAHLMQKHGVEQHRPAEYPKRPPPVAKDAAGKWLSPRWPEDHPRAGEEVEFADAEEEAAYYHAHG